MFDALVSAEVKDNSFLDWFSRGESRHPVFGKVSGRWFQHVFVHPFLLLNCLTERPGRSDNSWNYQ